MTKKKLLVILCLFLTILLIYQSIAFLKERIQSAFPLYQTTIVLDPGHGGKDDGTTGEHTFEKEQTLQTTKQLQKALSKLGATVYITRNDDTFIPLEQRAAFANKKNADLFVSIHYNSSPSAKPFGITTFYYHEKRDKPLAASIHSYLITETNNRDRGILYGNYQVLRENSVPSVLLELGFLSNKADEDKINTASYQQQLIKGICAGIVTYKKKVMK